MMNRILRLPLYGAIALLVYMPFHVFIAQWLSLYTGGIDFWKAGKDVFLLLALLLAYGLLIYKRRFKDKNFWIFTVGALVYFSIHFLVWAASPGIDAQAALLGTAYNSRLFGYLLLAWAAVLLYPGNFPLKNLFKIAIAVSSVVALFAIVQYVAPKDLMENFGYSLERGVKPNFFIDDKPDLPRVMSTIRDPNSLGAFLILPVTLLSVALIRKKKNRLLTGGLLLVNTWALLLTFSRSAFLGAALSVGIAFLWIYKAQATKFVKKYGVILLASLFLLLTAAFVLRDQYYVQNFLFHADESTRLEDPNDLRVSFFQKTVDMVAERPLGHGPGTAGLVSIQTDKVVLTENYFLQIAYEVGVQGLILLIALFIFICKLLFYQKNAYSKVLLASLAGITFSAMLLHTWSNEAVAAQWFILAGVALVWKQKRI